MITKFVTTIAAISAMILCTAFFTGCENDQFSQNEQPIPHKSFKPPLDDGNQLPPDDGIDNTAQVAEFDGTIKNISDLNLLVALENGEEKRFLLTPDTEVTLNENIAATTALATGQTAHIVAEVKEDMLTAIRIDAISKNEISADSDDKGTDEESDKISIEGNVASVSDSEVVIVDSAGIEHQFALTDQTKVTQGEKEAKIANIQVGQSVVATMIANDERRSAIAINIRE